VEEKVAGRDEGGGVGCGGLEVAGRMNKEAARWYRRWAGGCEGDTEESRWDEEKGDFPRECSRGGSDLHFAAWVEATAGAVTVPFLSHFEDVGEFEATARDSLIHLGKHFSVVVPYWALGAGGLGIGTFYALYANLSRRGHGRVFKNDTSCLL
jgi:hypothetical protein